MRTDRSSRRTLRSGIAAGAGLALAAFLWVALAPASLGGDFSYVFITGNSMAPGITNDDLVLLRAADDYDIGDAVAYTHPQLGTVLHRIIEDDGHRFTLRGDNRNSEDSYRPTEEEVLGRQWIKIPRAAGIIRELQSPRNAALLAVAAIAVGMIRSAGSGRGPDPDQPPGRRDRRRRNRPMSGGGRGGGGWPIAAGKSGGSGESPERTRRRWSPGSFSFFSSNHQPLSLLVALFLGSAALIGFVRLQGTTHTVSETLAYTTDGSFAYGATVEGGVYDGDQLGAPEPVFRQLTDRVPIDYDFALNPGTPGVTLTDITGSYQLVAEVSLENGWKRTLDLTPTTLFGGSEFNASAIVELSAVQAVIDGMQEATGVLADIYTLKILANVDYEADFEGLPISGSVEQPLEFRLTELQLQFISRNSQIESIIPSTTVRDVLADRSLSIPIAGISVPYRSIPQLAMYGVGVAMAGLLVMLLATVLVWQRGESARIRARYGQLIVDVRYDELELADRVLTVGQFEDLARIAETEGLMVFHRLARPAELEPARRDRGALDHDNVNDLRDDPRRLVDEYLAGGADAVELVNSRRVSTGRLFGGATRDEVDEYFVVDRDIAFRYATGELPHEEDDDGAGFDADYLDADESRSEVA